MEYFYSFILGWVFWSMSHYVGHRKWHINILQKKVGLATHGEHQHHIVYDQYPFDASKDPHQAYVSFPYDFVLPIVILSAVVYGHIFSLGHGISFFISAFISMTIDDRAHRSVHLVTNPHPLIQKFHIRHKIHHETHTKNFAFISGVLWDRVFNTYQAHLDQKPLKKVS